MTDEGHHFNIKTQIQTGQQQFNLKNAPSDDHFDRSFSFMAMEESYETKRKSSHQEQTRNKNMKTMTIMKKLMLALAFLSGCLVVVTLFGQPWIEALTGFEPDGHSGSLEGGFLATLLIVCVLAMQRMRGGLNA